MRYSDNYNLFLPNKLDKDAADIDLISENFRTIDEILKKAEGGALLNFNAINFNTPVKDIPEGVSKCGVGDYIGRQYVSGLLISINTMSILGKITQLVVSNEMTTIQRNSKLVSDGTYVWTEWDSYLTASDIDFNAEKVSQLDKRVTNLEQGITPSPFETDDTVAHSKIVPENALPYAEVSKVGGMTRKCTNLIPYPYFDETKTVNGITFVNNGDGSITINGTASNNADFFLFKNNNNVVKLTEGTTYVSNMPNGCRLMGYDAVQGAYPVLSTNGSSTTLSKAFSLNQVYISVTSGTTMDNIKLYPMLNEGTTALPYEPYFEGLRSASVTEVESKGVNGVISTFPIPESVQALDGYGWGINESAYNYVDFKKKQFVQRVVKVVFDGTEKWISTKISGYQTFRYTFVSGKIANKALLCSHYDFGGYMMDIDCCYVSTNNYQFHTSFSTVDEWKAYLAEQYSNGTPATVYAELVEPIITDVSDILSDDNYIAVEGGGTVTMINEFEYAVPSEITYQIKGAV